MDRILATKSEGVRLVVRVISFQDFHPMWSQSTNVTDGQTDRRTDGRHAIPRPRICTKVHCAVKIEWKMESPPPVVQTHKYTGEFDKCLTVKVSALCMVREQGISLVLLGHHISCWYIDSQNMVRPHYGHWPGAVVLLCDGTVRGYFMRGFPLPDIYSPASANTYNRSLL